MTQSTNSHIFTNKDGNTLMKEFEGVLQNNPQIRNLDVAIRRSTGLPVYIAEDPLLCVINGIGKVLTNFKELKSVLFKQD